MEATSGNVEAKDGSTPLASAELKPVDDRYKPSRFNVRTSAPDGSLILYNTYSGHCCVVPAAGAARAKQYLTQRGFARAE